MSETIFEQILNGKITAQKVYEDEYVIAIRDINPQAPEHILVIPRKKIERFSDLSAWNNEETGTFFRAIAKVALKLGYDEKGYRVVINCGDEGGQEVKYLHAHILAGRKMLWPPG